MQVVENIAEQAAFRGFAQESTTPLAANGVFTGPWIDLGPTGAIGNAPDSAAQALPGGKMTATSRADQSGTLTIQESADGIAAGQVIASTASAAVGGKQIANAGAVTALRYVRVVYTNGATIQTLFELDRIVIA